MKKTIIALLALAGVAGADTVNPLTDLNWQLGQGTSITDTKEMFYWGGGSTWAVYGSEAALANSITLQQNQVLTFSYTVNMSGGDSVTTFSLLGSNGAVSMGTAYKYQDKDTTRSAIRLGSSGEINNRYVISNSGDRDGVSYIRGENFTELTTPASANTPYTLTFIVTYDQTAGQFVGTLGYSLSTDVKQINLGNEFNVNKIAATFDGNTQTYVSNMSLSVVTIPEPTTATLSLLALAGLAVRRRRK